MDREEFPSNSQNPLQKPDSKKKPSEKKEKHVEKVTTETVIKRPRTLGDKAKDIFLSADIGSVFNYLAHDVLVPAIKGIVYDATTKGVERTLWGEERSPRRSSFGQTGARYTYHTPVQRGYSGPMAQPPRQERNDNRRQSIDNIVLTNRADAELVIESMNDILVEYGTVTVADLYNLTGYQPSYVDNDWGWTSMIGFNVRQRRDGYLLDLPPAKPI